MISFFDWARRYVVRWFPAFLLFALVPHAGLAQLPPSVSDSAWVSLLTVTPGDEVYSAFGHSAFRVVDPQTGLDVVFNYGTFDATDPWFIPKFTYGDMRYYLSFARTETLAGHAELEDRSVIEQELALDAEKAQALYLALRENARPENRFYQYDFIRDNCSTRLLDMIEGVAALRLPEEPATELTFREMVDEYVHERAPLDLGIDLVFGAGMDRPATLRERTFLPEHLMAVFDRAVIEETGAPLVVRTDTLLVAQAESARGGGVTWLTITTWILALLGIGLTYLVRRSPGSWDRLRMVLDRTFFGLLGLLGWFLLFMWFGTMHHVTAANWNLVWAFPGHLVVALAWRRFEKKARYMQIMAAVTAIFVLASPFLPQSLPPAALPIVILLVWRMWRNS